MTSRTTGVAIAPLEARTPTGAGMITPLVRAIWHILLVHTSIVNKWDMSLSEAIKELEEAKMHIDAATWLKELITPETNTVIKTWITEVDKYIADTQAKVSSRSDPKAHSTVNEPALKTLIKNSWQLVARLDLELTGLPATAVDPGSAR